MPSNGRYQPRDPDVQHVLARVDFQRFYTDELDRELPRPRGTGDVETNCVFHEDPGPSLSLNFTTGQFHCFGCGAGGDIFAFFRRLRGVGFRTALEQIAFLYANTAPDDLPSRRGRRARPSVSRALEAVVRERYQPPLTAAEAVTQTANGPRVIATQGDTAADERERCTELGNARRFVRQHRATVRFARDPGWLVWTGTRWEPDATEAVVRLAKRTVRTIHSEALQESEDSDNRRRLSRWALASEKRSAIDDMLKLARSESEVVAQASDFDRDPMEFNLLNGTVELQTGALREHRPEDCITKLAPVTYDPAAACPRFIQFVDSLMKGRTDLVESLQRAVGYTLTGKVSEDVLFLCYGGGGNGKSTFFEILSGLMGDYWSKSTFALLTAARDSGASEDIAKLHGARMVTAVEANRRQRLNEAVVKELTGGDPITARRLYGHLFTFWPTHKLWLATNHKPRIEGTDDGIWRRIVLIPFEARFTSDPAAVGQDISLARDRDAFVAELKAELPGILNWALAGCRDYLAHGLRVAGVARAATAAYREEEDDVQAFLAARCRLGRTLTVESAVLYQAYSDWADGADRGILAKNVFGERMTAKGFRAFRRGSRRLRDGLELVPEESSESVGPNDLTPDF